MGSSPSSLFPTSAVVCGEAVGSDSTDAARYDYACTTSASIRTGLTTLHLLLMVLAFFFTTALYVIYLRVSSRRESARLLAMPERRMMAADGLSRAMLKKVIAAQARIASDDVVPQPPKVNRIDGALAYGTRSNRHVYVVGIAADLLAFVREAVASEPRLPRGARTLPSLRAAADLLIDFFEADPDDIWPVIVLAERTGALGAMADPRPEEFSEFRDAVWRVMRSLEAAIARRPVPPPLPQPPSMQPPAAQPPVAAAARARGGTAATATDDDDGSATEADEDEADDEYEAEEIEAAGRATAAAAARSCGNVAGAGTGLLDAGSGERAAASSRPAAASAATAAPAAAAPPPPPR